MSRRFWNRLSSMGALLLALMLTTSCSDTAAPPAATPASVALVSGSGQTATVGGVLGSPLVVVVKDAQGNPLSGVRIVWTVADGGGSVAATQAQTNHAGQAQAVWTLGPTAGTQMVAAAVTGVAQPATFTATATSGAPSSITEVSGSGQTATVGELLDSPLAVVVKDAHGNPVSGAGVTWTVTAGSGAVAASQAQTNEAGQVQAAWTLGPAAGGQVVVAMVAGVSQPVTFGATARVGAPATLTVVTAQDLVRATGSGLITAVDVRDKFDNPVSGQTVSFSVAAGSGTADASSTTDAAGRAVTTWVMGSTAGSQRLEVRVGALAPAVVRATAAEVNLVVTSPTHLDRFLANDTVRATVQPVLPPGIPSDSIRWRLADGTMIGRGREPVVAALPAGSHVLHVDALGAATSVGIRVFSDLSALYLTAPSQSEIERIQRDFDIRYVDGPGTNEQWAPYGYEFFPNNQTPSRLVIIAKLDALRRQRFTKPLPFTGGRSLYDWLRVTAPRLNMTLGCNLNFGGSGQSTFVRYVSLWDGGEQSCKVPFTQPSMASYTTATIVVHEARHSDPADPGHVTCGDGTVGACDATLANPGGYGVSVLHAMWTYKYSLTDSPSVRDSEAAWAKMMLSGPRPIIDRSHPDPEIAALVQEILNR